MSCTGGPTSDDDDVSSVLTIEERSRIKEVITQDVEIRQFLQVSSLSFTSALSFHLEIFEFVSGKSHDRENPDAQGLSPIWKDY
jgi:hypothetical protein